MNSLFGKWGQRTDLPQTRIVNDGKSFLEIVRSPHLDIQSTTQIGQKLVVTFKDSENKNSPHAFTNVDVAAFISSWARVRLYELLDIVGMERLIYCDADSVIYDQKRDEPLLLTTGNDLGQLTNEIKDG